MKGAAEVGIENIAKNAGQSITGNIEKAIIEIVDETFKQKEINVTQAQPRKASSDSGLGQISGKLMDMSSKVAETTSTALVKYSPMQAVEEIQKNTVPDGPKKKRFQVKFNPSQITFSGVGGVKVEKKNYIDSEKNVQIEYQEMKPRIQMNLQLVFDDYERTQAFMLEKFTDATAALRTGIDGIVTAASGKTYSVRPQVEGFIGAIRNGYTRKVNFYWGTMKYSGEMTSVSVEYTMFSTDGNPIRANVNLGILLVDETLSYLNMGQWQDSYKKVFGTEEITNAGSSLQNAGNLLNINL